MALPPESIDKLLPLAQTIVVAEVLSVSSPPVAERDSLPNMPLGLGRKLPQATVRLKVERTLRGTAAAELEVVKPESTYALVPGITGPFLLDGERRILGRHGPDNYSVAAVTEALARGAR
ncbi:MAG: hypothetical protein IPJ65_21920 [Archangiaceae bacterium]|nr:hypothetical protein [Archangiaceae bacterium]